MIRGDIQLSVATDLHQLGLIVSSNHLGKLGWFSLPSPEASQASLHFCARSRFCVVAAPFRAFRFPEIATMIAQEWADFPQRLRTVSHLPSLKCL